MADLIPPRRNEFLTKDGIPTTRFAEYLERLTTKTNSTETDVDLISSIRPMVLESASSGNLEALEMITNLAMNHILILEKRINELEIAINQRDISNTSDIEKQIDTLNILTM